jgi:glycosyltransferase involved in cell wall biosynthesis
MSRATILVLTASHLCRNPRVVKEATALGAAGYDVTVMSVSEVERFARMDAELARDLPFRRHVIDLTRDPRRARTTRFLQRGATWGARWLCRNLHLESARALGPAGALLRAARAQTADLTIAHTEIPLWAAQILIKDGRRVAVDLEDWYSEDLLPADRRSRPLRLLRQAEAFALHHAAYVSTTSASMAAALAESYRCPAPLVLRNTFPLQPNSRLDRPTGTEPPGFIWFSQTVGPGRGLEQFLDAWAQTKQPSTVNLLGDARPGYREELLARLPSSRRAALRFLPLVSPAELPGKLAEFDLGLALESRQPRNHNLTISNKILQYLNAGLAVIATDTAGQGEVMRAAPACGLLLDTSPARACAARLDALVGDRQRLHGCQAAARAAAAADFCWEQDAPRLLAAVAGALHPSPRAGAPS